MPIESRPGYTRPGTRPPQTPLPPSYEPPVAPYVPPNSNPLNQKPAPVTRNENAKIPMNGFFGFILLMMGLK